MLIGLLALSSAAYLPARVIFGGSWMPNVGLRFISVHTDSPIERLLMRLILSALTGMLFAVALTASAGLLWWLTRFFGVVEDLTLWIGDYQTTVLTGYTFGVLSAAYSDVKGENRSAADLGHEI
jgi:hypothetical protein